MCGFFMFQFPMSKQMTRLRDQEAMDVVHSGHWVNVLASDSEMRKGERKKGYIMYQPIIL